MKPLDRPSPTSGFLIVQLCYHFDMANPQTYGTRASRKRDFQLCKTVFVAAVSAVPFLVHCARNIDLFISRGN
ncbi:hypothetical protein QBC45DRAFT_425918 [Copromyces sp. CBS 386.78]|nr:hypothetical protein QBC45DRAFT_425918 [Copromyces sp. CBS 386.78]